MSKKFEEAQNKANIITATTTMSLFESSCPNALTDLPRQRRLSVDSFDSIYTVNSLCASDTCVEGAVTSSIACSPTKRSSQYGPQWANRASVKTTFLEPNYPYIHRRSVLKLDALLTQVLEFKKSLRVYEAEFENEIIEEYIFEHYESCDRPDSGIESPNLSLASLEPFVESLQPSLEPCIKKQSFEVEVDPLQETSSLQNEPLFQHLIISAIESSPANIIPLEPPASSSCVEVVEAPQTPTQLKRIVSTVRRINRTNKINGKSTQVIQVTVCTSDDDTPSSSPILMTKLDSKKKVKLFKRISRFFKRSSITPKIV